MGELGPEIELRNYRKNMIDLQVFAIINKYNIKQQISKYLIGPIRAVEIL